MSSNKPHIVLQWIIGGLIAVAGVLSEIVDATTPHVGAYGTLHLLFGGMLCFAVMGRLGYRLWMPRANRFADVEAFTRQLTRSVYGLLYWLLAVKMLLPLVGTDPTSPESFQPYLISGVAAIVLARSLAISAQVISR